MQTVNFVVKDDDTEFMLMYPNGLSLSDLLPFYQAVSRNDPLKLEWVCHGKVTTSSVGNQGTGTAAATVATLSPVADSHSKAQQSTPGTAAKLAEFDFDEASHMELCEPAASVSNSGGASVLGSAAGVPMGGPLRRVGGANRPAPRQPRVANMDKILNDFFRTRKESTVPMPVPTSVIPTNQIVSDVETSVEDNRTGQNTMTVIPQHVTDCTSVGTDSTTSATVTALPIDHLTVADGPPDKSSIIVAVTADTTADVCMDSTPLDTTAGSALPVVAQGEFLNSASANNVVMPSQLLTLPSVEGTTHTRNALDLEYVGQNRTADFSRNCVAPDLANQKNSENFST